MVAPTASDHRAIPREASDRRDSIGHGPQPGPAPSRAHDAGCRRRRCPQRCGSAARRLWRLIETPVLADPEQPWRPHRVHGGLGTGKTSVIVDAAVARLTIPPSILNRSWSWRRVVAPVALREQITRRARCWRLARDGRTRAARTGLVHTAMFAVLRLQAQAHDNPSAAP